MKTPFLLALASLATSAFADEYSRTIFADDFSGDKFGPRWGHYKSGSIVKDGVLMGITPDGSAHNAVDSVKFDAERDLGVGVTHQRELRDPFGAAIDVGAGVAQHERSADRRQHGRDRRPGDARNRPQPHQRNRQKRPAVTG